MGEWVGVRHVRGWARLWGSGGGSCPPPPHPPPPPPPFQSVTLEAMATAFGVSPEFVEAEVADLVASGRLDAQVDAVDGVVRARRGDERAGHYAAALRAGDALLNRLQALSKVADHE